MSNFCLIPFSAATSRATALGVYGSYFYYEEEHPQSPYVDKSVVFRLNLSRPLHPAMQFKPELINADYDLDVALGSAVISACGQFLLALRPLPAGGEGGRFDIVQLRLDTFTIHTAYSIVGLEEGVDSAASQMPSL